MEKISALMDGELDEHQALQQIEQLKQDEGLAHCWHAYHLIGDAMRDERGLSRDFGLQMARRIAAEPTILAPRRSTVKRATAYALSAAASLSAIAVVGWVSLSTGPLAPQSELAKAPITPVVSTASAPAPAAPAPVAAPVPVLASVPSDGKMNEYLMAHQEFSPSTAIQGVAPYIRSVSITRQSQGR
jgi:sigma-E factor negative regulatory protein RseA